jgi:hypothetical protein
MVSRQYLFELLRPVPAGAARWLSQVVHRGQGCLRLFTVGNARGLFLVPHSAAQANACGRRSLRVLV